MLLSGLAQSSAGWGENRAFLFEGRLNHSALKEALIRVLRTAPFRILNGRLLADPTRRASGETALIAVENDAGHEFHFTVVNDEKLCAAMRELPASVSRDARFREFYPPPSLGLPGPKTPLLHVKITRFEPIGYTLVAFTVSHGICDAASTFMFWQRWGYECSRLPTARESPPHPPPALPVYALTSPLPLFSQVTLSDKDVERMREEEALVQSLLPKIPKSPYEHAPHERMRVILSGSRLEALKRKICLRMVSSASSHEGDAVSWVSTANLILALAVGGSLTARLISMASTLTVDAVRELQQQLVTLTVNMRNGRGVDDSAAPLFGNLYAKPTCCLDVPLEAMEALILCAGNEGTGDGGEREETKISTTNGGGASSSSAAEMIDEEWLESIAIAIHNMMHEVTSTPRGIAKMQAWMRDSYERTTSTIDPRLATALLDTLGYHFISWGAWKWFDVGFGDESTSPPLFMTNTPLFDHVVIPRMILAMPCSPRGDVDLLVTFTPAENEGVRLACERLKLLVC